MSLVSTYVKAVDGKWYQNPVLEGHSASGHGWFLCFDDDDPPEFVYETSKLATTRQTPDAVLKAAGITFSRLHSANVSGRLFGGSFQDAQGFFVTITAPIPIPQKFDAAFDAKPQVQGCYFGFEPMKGRR